MTPKQTSLYWREWAAVRRACVASGLEVPERHVLHARALGADKSSKAFSNEDFDRVLAEFRAMSRPDSVNSQLRQIRQPRARMEMSLEEVLRCMALYVGDVEAYVGEICLKRFGTPDWRDLSDVKIPHRRSPGESSSPLEEFRWTVSRALNGKSGLRNRAGDSLHEMKTKAGVECHCATFCSPRPGVSPGAIPAPEVAVECAEPHPF